MIEKCKITIPIVRYNKRPNPRKIMVGTMVDIAKRRLERWLDSLDKKLTKYDGIRLVSFNREEERVIAEYKMERDIR